MLVGLAQLRGYVCPAADTELPCACADCCRGAVEFLLLAGQMDQAYDIAAARGEMDTFAAIVGAGASAPAELERIAGEKGGQLCSLGHRFTSQSIPGGTCC